MVTSVERGDAKEEIDLFYLLREKLQAFRRTLKIKVA